MRILMLAQFYPPMLGGTEQYVRALSSELVARGHDVSVATIWHEGQPPFEIDQGIRVHRIRSSMQHLPWLFGSERRYAPPFPDPELTLELKRVMQEEQPQIVHAHNWLVRSFLPLKKGSQTRLIISLHDYSLTCVKKSFMYRDVLCSGPGLAKCLDCAVPHYGLVRGMPTVLINRAMSSTERANADMFLAVSQAIAENNGLVGGQRPFQVIPNFIGDDVGDETGTEQDVASYLSQLPDEQFFLYVGALSREKGIEVLLRAYSGLVNRAPTSGLAPTLSYASDRTLTQVSIPTKVPPLVLIGYPTPDWQMPEMDGAQNIFVFKDWPHEAVMSAWRRCSVALIPSIWSEPFGIVALEAMSMGKPIIASRIGGLPDIVVDNETGLLVPPGDAQALQEALQGLLDDPERRDRMGSKGRQRVKSFRAKTIVPRIEQMYQDVVAS